MHHTGRPQRSHAHRRRTRRIDRCKQCGRRCLRTSRRRRDSLCRTCLLELRQRINAAADTLTTYVLARIR